MYTKKAYILKENLRLIVQSKIHDVGPISHVGCGTQDSIPKNLAHQKRDLRQGQLSYMRPETQNNVFEPGDQELWPILFLVYISLVFIFILANSILLASATLKFINKSSFTIVR